LESFSRSVRITEVDLLLITRSEAGISLFDRLGNRSDFPVHAKEVKDVTGAGDTVLAVMSLALANQLDMSVAVQLADIAAGLAILINSLI
jgi:D-beta-D-heptose 7-phosphate kinase/D-beta-D-heptose 1-phosphate adenosyltransferase